MGGNWRAWFILVAGGFGAMLAASALDLREPPPPPFASTSEMLDAGDIIPSGASAILAGSAELRYVEPGVTVLLRDSLHLVRGRRVGLLTNHSAIDADGRRTADLLYAAPGVNLVALFAPEHGLGGRARGGAHIRSGVDSATGVPIRSLYGSVHAPTPAMLADIDVLLYDVQDVGARPYTFVWTMTLAAESAAKRGIPIVVLDRPAPVRGDVMEGGMLRPQYRSLVGRAAVPLRYGLTPGELASWMAGTGLLDATVQVVPAAGWKRDMWFDETRLPWVRPSPNIPTLDAALLFAGMVFFEATNVSEGRGTRKPFHYIGAPWMTDAAAIARAMNSREIPGLRFRATHQRIGAGEKYGGRTIPVIEITITDRDEARPVRAAVWLLREIASRHPRNFRWQRGRGIEELSGSAKLRQAVTSSDAAVDRLLRDWDGEADQFRRAVEPYRLYP
ncbi:MAG TPA: DUF1343 domain-containing protein [Gemmatimonadaceae bacterium]|nr:DUF1343 domain-containing protein [Gemmatimonadaceae bacterium]